MFPIIEAETVIMKDQQCFMYDLCKKKKNINMKEAKS